MQLFYAHTNQTIEESTSMAFLMHSVSISTLVSVLECRKRPAINHHAWFSGIDNLDGSRELGVNHTLAAVIAHCNEPY